MPLPVPPTWPAAPRFRWGPAVPWFVVGTLLVAFGLVLAASPDGASWTNVGLGLYFYSIGVRYGPRRGFGVESRDGALAFPMSRLRTYVPLAGFAAWGLGCVVDGSIGLPLVLALWVVALALVVLINGLGGEVRLDPEGVSLPPRHRIAWGDEVTSRRFRTMRVGGVTVRPERYDADPSALYWTLRYSATHPESRDELADGRALDRVEREALV